MENMETATFDFDLEREVELTEEQRKYCEANFSGKEDVEGNRSQTLRMLLSADVLLDQNKNPIFSEVQSIIDNVKSIAKNSRTFTFNQATVEKTITEVLAITA